MTLRLCECGCGGPIPLAKVNSAPDGLVRGQQTPARFLRGHHLRVTRPPWWRGDDASYGAIHTYLRKHFPKSGVCEECGKAGETDYALIKGRSYSRNREDYRELCRQCHVNYDEIGGSRWRGIDTARKLAGQAPSCRCGCGTQVTFDSSHGHWHRYAAGHYAGAARALRG